MSDGQMVEHLFVELERLGATDIVISTNRAPYSRSKAMMEDPGAAVYFKRKGQDICIACDKYKRVEDNIHAVGIAVESFRTIERHGTGEMVDAAFTGFKALPESIEMGAGQILPWYVVLQVSQDADQSVIKAAYRNLAAKYHPDNQDTGNAAKFAQVQDAYKQSGAA